MNFKFLKENPSQDSYKWSYMQKTSVKEKKSIHFQNKRVHDLETLEGIHKKNATLLETYYWRIVENFLVCYPKIEGDYTKKLATGKHRFPAPKEVIGSKLSKNQMAFQ